MRSPGFSIALIASQILFGISLSFSTNEIFAKQDRHTQPYPQRIITLAPHLSELVDSAGGSDRLVGVSAFSNFPTSVKQLPITSDARSIDLEKMKSLGPDLIIYWRGGTSESQIQSIKKTFTKDVQFIAVEPKKLLDIATDIETIGKALGTDLVAKKNADVLRLKITELRNKENNQNKQKNISQRKVRVFYQVWAQPLMTLNQDHIISDIIQLCGGEQLFANEKVLVPTVSREAVIKANPEIIFTAVDNQKMTSDWSMWTSFSQLAATKNKAFVDLDGDIISRPSPRIMQGAQKICTEINQLR
ncbi:helical backbone metal receptor [Polynucleobacter cosmopolitanus]|uniref:Cobalamin-binding protein n=1 Tax=Polynucleobacter cosmopolitanus TaxID=351345 RepID=A0A229FWD7_9BURK|nr:helical backbone metal receptor [Polynucleobacter cosmopolitanus]OXL16317.1 cobalamin-binding protein [Polynucleobacter cosmopolitanus]